jgi:hypothetical protein
MPSDVKAILSVVALAVAVAFAYWEVSAGNGHLFWLVIGFGAFAVVAMWVFPEAVGKSRGGKAHERGAGPTAPDRLA